MGGVVSNGSIGEKEEFRLIMVSHWLNCWGSLFLVGDVHLLGAVISYCSSSLVGGPIIDNSYCD